MSRRSNRTRGVKRDNLGQSLKAMKMRPMARAVRGGVEVDAAWSPVALFSSGEQGGIYDPSDISTLWQDVAGTSPVTADGQTVNRIDDISGNGLHLRSDAVDASSTAPVYRSGGYLEAADDGAFNIIRLGSESSSGTLTQAVPMSFMYGLRPSTTNGTTNMRGLCVVKAAAGSSSNFMALGVRGDVDRSQIGLRGLSVSVGQTTVDGTNNDVPEGSNATIYCEFVSGSMSSEINGTAGPGGAHGWTTESQAGQVGLGAMGNAGRFYGGVVIDRAMASGERTQLEAWLQTRIS